ncbi:MAG: aconitase X swivel domain-containing protein [Thermoplasmata archaeon]
MTSQSYVQKVKAACERNSEGEVLFSKKSVNFYLVDPVTSEILEDDHPLKGIKVKGKALVIPSGKGSSVVQLDGLYQLLTHNNQPSMIVVKDPDPVIVSAAIICDVPIVTGVSDEFMSMAKKGGSLILDCKGRELTFIEPGAENE